MAPRTAALKDPTVAFLHSHGITVSPESLDELVQEAVARMERTLYRPDARADLSGREVETLERGGDSAPGASSPPLRRRTRRSR